MGGLKGREAKAAVNEEVVEVGKDAHRSRAHDDQPIGCKVITYEGHLCALSTGAGG